MKKITQTSLLAVSLCTVVSSTIFADDPAPTSAGDQRTKMITDLQSIKNEIGQLPNGLASGISSGIASGFANLEAYLDTKYLEGKQWVVKQDYKTIPHLQDVINTNTAQVTPPGASAPLTPAEAASQQAKSDTSANLHNSLTQFIFSMYQSDPNVTKDIKTAQGKPYSEYLQKNSNLKLSVGGKEQAQDSLFVADTISKSKEAYTNPQSQPWLKAPATITNDFLNFSTILSPTVYTPQQQEAAKLFEKYGAQSDLDLTEGVQFSKLYKNPAALLSLKQNSTYQKYVVAMRGFLAVRSMTLNTLNELIAERTPIAGLGPAAGLTTPDASPLQVESYQAGRRALNPAWYTEVNNTAPSAVQREILIVLAEIEQQNYQAHLDRERLLAAVTALSLQSSAASSSVFITQENNKIKELIDGSVKATQKPVASTSSAPPSTTPKMQTSAPPGIKTTTP